MARARVGESACVMAVDITPKVFPHDSHFCSARELLCCCCHNLNHLPATPPSAMADASNWIRLGLDLVSLIGLGPCADVHPNAQLAPLLNPQPVAPSCGV